MSEYTYEFPDTTAFMYTLRRFLEISREAELSALLAGATCDFQSSTQYSRIRWDTYYATINFRVAVDNLDGFSDEDKRKLLEFAAKVMPPEVGYELMSIEISPSLQALPSPGILSELSVELASLKHQFNPIFGQPAIDPAFRCDVFMVMPFDDEFEPVYKRIVVPTITSLGLTIKRGDDPFSKHEIMYEIWSMLSSCRLVIADCTGRNPNVFYELGIAHTIGRPVILLTQNLSELPFDVRNRRAIQYDMKFHKIDELKSQLNTAVRNILKLEDEIPF